MFAYVRTDLRRIAQGIEPCIEKAHPAAAEWVFSGTVTQFSFGLVMAMPNFISSERIRKISIPITRRSIGDC